ncbi:MAG: GDSL-type esterase/lipase family protein [Myxococcota bacterium]
MDVRRLACIIFMATCGCATDAGRALSEPTHAGGHGGGTSSMTTTSGPSGGGGSGEGGAAPEPTCDDPGWEGVSLLAAYRDAGAVVAPDCHGTAHQRIEGVERVVFLGDSITVGTPPTAARNTYRARLADTLATLWSLNPPGVSWRVANPTTGRSLRQEEGAFASCATWGARSADVVHEQLGDCFQGDDFGRRTLVVMTVGGNDMQDVAKAALAGEDDAALTQRVDDAAAAQREVVSWLTTPGRFSAEVFVVVANTYEFTDRRGDWSGCDIAPLVGFDQPLATPDAVLEHLDRLNLELVRLAVETDTDVVFAHEAFCGRGVHAADAAGPCFRGPDVESWFDLTCIHPNRRGHERLAHAFAEVIVAADE